MSILPRIVAFLFCCCLTLLSISCAAPRMEMPLASAARGKLPPVTVMPVTAAASSGVEAAFVRSLFVEELSLGGRHVFSSGPAETTTLVPKVETTSPRCSTLVAEGNFTGDNGSIPAKITGGNLTAEVVLYIDMLEATRTVGTFSASYRLMLRFRQVAVATGKEIWAQEYTRSGSVWGFNRLRLENEIIIRYGDALADIIRSAAHAVAEGGSG